MKGAALVTAGVVAGLTLASFQAGGMHTPARNSTETRVAHATVTADDLRRQLKLERTRHAAETRALRSQLATRTSIDSAIRTAAATYNVPASQIRRVAYCESRMQARAVGSVHVGGERAVGLMQFLPSTFRRQTPHGRAGLDPMDPYVSALAAASIVSREGWRQWACKP